MFREGRERTASLPSGIARRSMSEQLVAKTARQGEKANTWSFRKTF